MPFASAPSITQRLVGQWPIRWSCGASVGARRERREGLKMFSSLVATHSGGRRKMNSVVQNDTVLVFYIYIYIYETTSFWIKHAVSFKWAKLQISPPSFLVHFNCIPAKFGPRPHSWPRFSLWSLASDLCNLALNWLINFQFLQLGPWTE